MPADRQTRRVEFKAQDCRRDTTVVFFAMTTANPFPGMNPFIEQQWRDAHTMLISYLRDHLQERLSHRRSR
jgi:hypothetical protein